MWRSARWPCQFLLCFNLSARILLNNLDICFKNLNLYNRKIYLRYKTLRFCSSNVNKQYFKCEMELSFLHVQPSIHHRIMPWLLLDKKLKCFFFLGKLKWSLPRDFLDFLICWWQIKLMRPLINYMVKHIYLKFDFDKYIKIRLFWLFFRFPNTIEFVLTTTLCRK